MAETATHTAELTMVDSFGGQILIRPELSQDEYADGLQALHRRNLSAQAAARSFSNSVVDGGTEYRVLVTGYTELERRAQLLVDGMRELGVVIVVNNENLVA